MDKTFKVLLTGIFIFGLVAAFEQGYIRGYVAHQPTVIVPPAALTVAPLMDFTNATNVKITVEVTNTINVIEVPSDVEIPDDTNSGPTLNDGTLQLNSDPTNQPAI
jgi:hypothetical protein